METSQNSQTSRIPQDSQREIVGLLKKNNELLEKMYKLQVKEHRAETWRTVFKVFINLLPFIILVIVGYYIFSVINANIQALQSNINALRDFVAGLIPDFSGVGETLNNVWKEIAILK